MKIGCSGLERLLLLLSAGAAINAAPAASSAAAAADAASLVDLPHSFFETLHTKLPPNGHQQEKNFPKTDGPGPRDVTASSREGGVMAEEAPPRARSSWNGIVLFFA